MYAFDQMNFTNDLNHYKDREHYLPHINIKILEWIKKKENRLTLENVGHYESGFSKMLNEKKVISTYTDTNSKLSPF